MDKVTIDLKKNGKMSNVTVNYCVVDLNEDAKDEAPLVRHLTWTEFDRPEQLVQNGVTQEAKSVPMFDTFNFDKTTPYVIFDITSIKTILNFGFPEDVKELTILNKLKPEIPQNIQALNGFAFAKPHYWDVKGIYMKNKLKKQHTALCYSWRSLIQSGRGYKTSDDISTVARSVKEAWLALLPPEDTQKAPKDKMADQKDD